MGDQRTAKTLEAHARCGGVDGALPVEALRVAHPAILVRGADVRRGARAGQVVVHHHTSNAASAQNRAALSGSGSSSRSGSWQACAGLSPLRFSTCCYAACRWRVPSLCSQSAWIACLPWLHTQAASGWGCSGGAAAADRIGDGKHASTCPRVKQSEML